MFEYNELICKELISKELKETHREGMEGMIEYMEQVGYFEAPCSTQYHLAKAGGLAEHSYNVLSCARSMANALPGANVPEDSLVIVCLLHDLGKCGQYGKPYYKKAPLLKSGKEPAKPFISNNDLLPVAHETRSVTVAGRYIDLTEEEQFAILYHNGMYGSNKYDLQGHETPLYMLLHYADMWASRVMETGDKCE